MYQGRLAGKARDHAAQAGREWPFPFIMFREVQSLDDEVQGTIQSRFGLVIHRVRWSVLHVDFSYHHSVYPFSSLQLRRAALPEQR